MAAFNCACGKSINLIISPNSQEGSLLSSKDNEQWKKNYIEKIQSFLELNETERAKYIRKLYNTSTLDDIKVVDVIDDILDQTDLYSRAVIVCDDCHRIYIQTRQGSQDYTCYTQERPI